MKFEWFSSSGRSCLSPDNRFVVVSNLFDGFDWYSISDRAIRNTIPIRISQKENLPIPVMFTTTGDAMIAGGTTGDARVLDSLTSETLQLLPQDGSRFPFLEPPHRTHPVDR